MSAKLPVRAIRGSELALESLRFASIPAKECPIKAKTSDSSVADAKIKPKRDYLTPAGLARLVGPLKGQAGRKRKVCSERTVREWCKGRLVSEAYQTKGGHWRIQKPLSWQTRVFLAKQTGKWPFKKGSERGYAEADYQMAEWLTLAIANRQGLLEELPVRTLAEPDDDSPDDKETRLANRIQNEIVDRLKKKKPFNDLLLDGWMYQWINYSSQEDPPCPTVAQFAEFMGLSRQAFYRRYPNAKTDIACAFERAGGKMENELPQADSPTAIQMANSQAKKTNYIGDGEPDPYARPAAADTR